MPDLVQLGSGGRNIANSVSSTGAQSWNKLSGTYRHSGVEVTQGNSTSAVTLSVVIQGRINPDSSTGAITLLTWSSTGAGVQESTHAPITEVRARVDTLTSTSSTAPTATVWYAGAQ